MFWATLIIAVLFTAQSNQLHWPLTTAALWNTKKFRPLAETRKWAMFVLWVILLTLSLEKCLRLLVKYQSWQSRAQTLLSLPIQSSVAWEPLLIIWVYLTGGDIFREPEQVDLCLHISINSSNKTVPLC